MFSSPAADGGKDFHQFGSLGRNQFGIKGDGQNAKWKLMPSFSFVLSGCLELEGFVNILSLCVTFEAKNMDLVSF